jgi:putative ABC transport system permease protein
MDVIFTDFDFARTYGVEIIKGRDFSRDFSTDLKAAFLINETAARKLGWGSDAVGRKIGFSPDQIGPVIGIMKDFHYRALREKIGPLVIKLNPEDRIFLSLKIRADDVAGTVAYVKDIWKSKTEREFDYFFVDEAFDSLYRSEERLSQIIAVFAFMAIFVACLGLFGLASFGAEQRTKEIGVRKVLGASEMNLAVFLSREFLKWVLLANAVALPAVYILMTRLWLSNFVYRTGPSLWIFASVAGFSLLISILTVSYQAVKAALANPVDSLRYE